MDEQNSEALILVVDDHAPAAEMVSRLFTMRGYETICAFSGKEAIEIANKQQPDLILLDVMMPGMDGYQVLEALRSKSATEKIPIIFITAKDDVEDIAQGFQLGADDYIPKPVKPRELIARAKTKIEAYHLRERLEQKTTDLSALLRFSEALNNHLAIKDLMDLVLYLALDLLPSFASIIYRISENQTVVDSRMKSTHDVDVEIDIEGLKKYFSYETDTVIWEADAPTVFSSHGCGMAFGLKHGEQLHGILVILSENGFTENYRQLFENIGRQTTLALRNAELYQVKVDYAERLEEMVEERTAELRSAQELLIRAEKLASVGRLAAGIAHEINNPLMPIRFNLEMMAEDVEAGQPVSPRDIEETLRSVNRIRRTVEQLQQFTRKRGENVPVMQTVNISSILEDVISLSNSYIRNSGIKVETTILENIHVTGNPDQLEQVFLNIILNAHAAMENGDTLIVETKLTEHDVIVRIQDTGQGIPEDMLGKIFEPFVTSKDSGSGLGLFISYGIIENHSGKIEVESKVGKGTIFSITLPRIV